MTTALLGQMAYSKTNRHLLRWLGAFSIAVALNCVPKQRTTEPNRTEPAKAPDVSLHMASLQGNTRAVREHIAAGSPLDQKDAYGSTPLTIAITFGKVDVTRALVAAGADLQLTDKYGSTPLHLAAFFAHPVLVELLLEAGADRRIRSASGATAFDVVQSPFDMDRASYDSMHSGLKALGLELDYQRIRATRPRMARLLRAPPEELPSVKYAPEPGPDWPVSTPAQQGLDPALVREFFWDAAAVEKLFGLAVVKNGQLVAEGYFNGSGPKQTTHIQSVTKSFTSAAVGIALEQGCLESIDQRVVEFFPEYANQLKDPRKRQVTIRQLLQMRGGFPWEETDQRLYNALLHGALLELLVDFPLVNDPGAAFAYSNLSSHWLGVIVARACKTDLKRFQETHLLGPLDATLGEWIKERDGYYVGLAEMQLTLRDMAKFGLLYLDEGKYKSRQVVPAAWVRASLENYSEDAWVAQPPQRHAGRYFSELGYGYQWWSATIGDREFDFAWGHGGQLVVLLEELDMVIVAKSDPWLGRSDAESWKHERATLNLVGKFIRSLSQT